MKLSSVSKDRWNNIDYKELFYVQHNCVTYGRFSFSLSVTGNASLLGVIKHGYSLDLCILIEQQS